MSAMVRLGSVPVTDELGGEVADQLVPAVLDGITVLDHPAGSAWQARDRRTAEVLYVMAGSAVVTDTGGLAHRIDAGDLVVLPIGWSGAWEVHTRIRLIAVTG